MNHTRYCVTCSSKTGTAKETYEKQLSLELDYTPVGYNNDNYIMWLIHIVKWY